MGAAKGRIVIGPVVGRIYGGTETLYLKRYSGCGRLEIVREQTDNVIKLLEKCYPTRYGNYYARIVEVDYRDNSIAVGVLCDGWRARPCESSADFKGIIRRGLDKEVLDEAVKMISRMDEPINAIGGEEFLASIVESRFDGIYYNIRKMLKEL